MFGSIRRKIHRISEVVQTKYCKHGIILIYHRVANLSSDPQLLSVSAEHFEQQMDCLSRNYHPVSLVDLLQFHINPGKMPDRCVAVTFDDGYSDNLHNAKPILEKYHVPATIFVTTGMIGSDREFWWDELERILLLPNDLPDTLDLNILGKNFHWSLSADPIITTSRKSSEKNHVPQNISWNVTMTSLPTARHYAYRDLHQLLRPLDMVERDRVLKQLYLWAGIPETGRPNYRALTHDEISYIADGELIDIGSHGRTHSVLKKQPAKKQEIEIIESKKILQQILNREISSFSYPFGGRKDFTFQTMNLVKKTGYVSACANFPGPVTRWTNNYALPRNLVRDWDKDEFSRNLSMWYNG